MPQTTGKIVAFLNLHLHDDGAMSIEGNVDDWKLCRNMLDAAHSALHARIKPKDGEPVPRTRMISATQETGIRP